MCRVNTATQAVHHMGCLAESSDKYDGEQYSFACVHIYDKAELCSALEERVCGCCGASLMCTTHSNKLRNSCKHNGAVLPLPSAPEGRGGDGVDAMA
jgi:hypothetical protein